jgi:hypothetical protein
MCAMSLIQGELSVDFSNLHACPDDELEAAEFLLRTELNRRFKQRHDVPIRDPGQKTGRNGKSPQRNATGF